jgi:hypothetical protein
MLIFLLPLLLPRKVTKHELEFHTQFVLRAYRGYYDHLLATGLCDRRVLTKVKNQTVYSMVILLYNSPKIWMSVFLFHFRLTKIKMVLPLKEISRLLFYPLITE